MRTNNEFEFENQFLRSYIKGETAIIKFLSNPYEIASNIELSTKLFNLISFADDSKTIRSLLIIPDLCCCDEESYHNFINGIFTEENAENHTPKVRNSDSREKRIQQINLLNRFILRLIDFKKISVMALQGSIVTPFIGVSLATDFRIASSDMHLSFAHVDHGVHPTGALPFFLSKILTPSQSKNYLLLGGKIDAETSFNLNLVDKVFESIEFESKCIAYMNELNRINFNLVRSIKRLMYNKKEVENYFDKESQLLLA